MHATRPSPELDLARSLDARLVAARKVQRGAEHRLAILLAELADTGGHRLLGYASIEQYAMAALELTSRVARDLLRIGRSMPELPRLNAALAAGEVDWTKAREVVRVATAETDASWTERAKTMSARVIEREVAAARIGDPAPTGDPDPELRPARARHSFEMEAADAEVLYQALALLRARSDLRREEIDDGAGCAGNDVRPMTQRTTSTNEGCPRAIPTQNGGADRIRGRATSLCAPTPDQIH